MESYGINVNRLKGKIVENGMSVSTLAEKLGIDRTTLYRRLDNAGSGLLVKDANRIVEILNLSPDDALAIFFPQQVA